MQAMKRLAHAVALALMLASGSLQAGGGHSLKVNATVLSFCRFLIPGTTLNFNLDPLGAGILRQTAPVQFICSKGTTATLALKSASTGSATGGKLIRGAESIAYTYTRAGGGGRSNGPPKTLSVQVSINQGLSANVSSGLYTDTIAITLTP
jgi:spore coat protein U-like protein